MAQSVTGLTEAEEFEGLARALRRAKGFALYFARCNVPAHRAKLAQRLKEAVKRPVVEVELPFQEDFFGTLERASREAPPEAIAFIYGLEGLRPSLAPERAQETLAELNWRRGAYQRLERPLVFWVPEYVVGLLREHAPDFFDWNSGLYVFEVPREVRDTAMRLALDQTGDADSLDVNGKRERLALLRNLEEEYGGDSPTERAALAEVIHRAGSLYHSLGNYKEARAHFERALRIFRQFLGDEHPTTLTVKRNLGSPGG